MAELEWQGTGGWSSPRLALVSMSPPREAWNKEAPGTRPGRPGEQDCRAAWRQRGDCSWGDSRSLRPVFLVFGERSAVMADLPRSHLDGFSRHHLERLLQSFTRRVFWRQKCFNVEAKNLWCLFKSWKATAVCCVNAGEIFSYLR